MTLVEVIVVLAIVGILFVPILNMIFDEVQLTNRTKEQVNAKDVVIMVNDYTYKKVAFSDTITLADIPAGSVGEESKTQSLYFNGSGDFVHRTPNSTTKKLEDRVIYSRSVLGNCDMTFEVEKISDNMIEVIITALRAGKGDILYTNISQIAPNNMTRLNKKVADTPTGNVITFTIPD